MARMVAVLVLLGLLPATVGMVMASSPSAVGDSGWNPPAPAAESVGGWQVYGDGDFGISFEYPTSWRAEITIDAYDLCPKDIPLRPEWILRRHTFGGEAGTIDLDIWAAQQDMDLSGWLEWLGSITAPFRVTEPSARVAGHPAVAFVKDQMLTVFFSDGKHVYRL